MHFSVSISSLTHKHTPAAPLLHGVQLVAGRKPNVSVQPSVGLKIILEPVVVVVVGGSGVNEGD